LKDINGIYTRKKEIQSSLDSTIHRCKLSYIKPLKSVSGAISRTLTNPLERLKMLKQVKVPEYEGLTVWRSFLFMW
jgi:hypothetical protein